MALNIDLDLKGQPLRRETESFILKRDKIEFEVKLDTNSLISSPFMKGRLLLTTQRLVLLNDEAQFNKYMKSFEIALVDLCDEKLEKPKLGSSYFRGTVKAPNDIKDEEDFQTRQEFKIWFQGGSSDCFMYAISTCLKILRETEFNAE